MTIEDLLATPTEVAHPELAVSSLRCALRFLDPHEMPTSLACVEQPLAAKGYVLGRKAVKVAWQRAIRAELLELRPHSKRLVLRNLLRLS